MSETQTIALTDFLLARIEEDEEAARNGAGWDPSGRERTAGRWRRDGMNIVEVDHGRLVVYGDGPAPSDGDAAHIARHDPARVLAECAAKRRIVEEAERIRPMATSAARDTSGDADVARWAATDKALRALASVYADHEGFRPEWAL